MRGRRQKAACRRRRGTSISPPTNSPSGCPDRKPTRSAEVALAFCKECRGWRNAQCVNDWGYPYIREAVSRDLADTKFPPYERQFHYMHLGQVIPAVREWLETASGLPAHNAAALAKIIPDLLVDHYFGSLDEQGLCYGLMVACVEANRGRQGMPKHA